MPRSVIHRRPFKGEMQRRIGGRGIWRLHGAVMPQAHSDAGSRQRKMRGNAAALCAASQQPAPEALRQAARLCARKVHRWAKERPPPPRLLGWRPDQRSAARPQRVAALPQRVEEAKFASAPAMLLQRRQRAAAARRAAVAGRRTAGAVYEMRGEVSQWNRHVHARLPYEVS